MNHGVDAGEAAIGGTMSRIFVLSDGDLPVADGVLTAVGSQRLEADRATREALRELRPGCLLLDPAFEGGRGLELMAALEKCDLRVPVLVPFADADTEWSPRSLFLTPLRSPVCSVDELHGLLIEAVLRAAQADVGRPMFSVWDYLSLAFGSRLSALLSLTLSTGETLAIKLVDGEPWTFDGRAGERPLRQLLDAAVYRVGVRPLDSAAAKRGQARAGQTMQDLAQHAGLGGGIA
ncbi:MAG TPA: hypothetical protein VKU40_17205 [Thermoanaerobaculia bacterium]|nr:hypothetical protein [Thermoanaerobaculia bacterium]